MKLSRITLVVAVIAGLLLLMSGPGYRLEIWGFQFGFQMMRWAVYVGLAGAGFSVLFLLIPRMRRGQAIWLGAAIVIGLISAYIPWHGLQQARAVPPIHDISTDTVNPPAFVAILPLRADAPNPPEYAGSETAAQQHEAYPDLQPVRMDGEVSQAFQLALTAAEGMGWDLIAVDPTAGRIEATATTFWYGFKDDVVIRVRAVDGVTVLDVRSKSRIGRSDVGANAARIRAYLERLAP